MKIYTNDGTYELVPAPWLIETDYTAELIDTPATPEGYVRGMRMDGPDPWFATREVPDPSFDPADPMTVPERVWFYDHGSDRWGYRQGSQFTQCDGASFGKVHKYDEWDITRIGGPIDTHEIVNNECVPKDRKPTWEDAERAEAGTWIEASFGRFARFTYPGAHRWWGDPGGEQPVIAYDIWGYARGCEYTLIAIHHGKTCESHEVRDGKLVAKWDLWWLVYAEQREDGWWCVRDDGQDDLSRLPIRWGNLPEHLFGDKWRPSDVKICEGFIAYAPHTPGESRPEPPSAEVVAEWAKANPFQPERDEVRTQPTATELIAAERKRQIGDEGYTEGFDDAHAFLGQLAMAAACYLVPDDQVNVNGVVSHVGNADRITWPWLASTYKRTPRNRIRELVKAGALVAAEIERLQRASSPSDIVIEGASQ